MGGADLKEGADLKVRTTQRVDQNSGWMVVKSASPSV